MDLDLTPEQRELDTVGRRLLSELSPLSVARAYLDGAGDATGLWQQMRELGWYVVGQGNDPFGVPGLACLARAIGEHAAPTPLVDTAVAAHLARHMVSAGHDDDLLRRVSGGELTVGVAIVEAASGWRVGRLVDDSLQEGTDGFIVSATKWNVLHGAAVDAYAVVVKRRGALSVAFVPADAPGIRLEPERAMDPSIGLATVVFDEVPVTEARCARDLPEKVLDDALGLGAVLSCAEALGAADRSLDMAIDYSRDRTQFGRAIGSFQALQHLMATAHIRREAAWSTTLHAAATFEEELPDRLESISIAKAYATEAAQEIVEIAIQVLGGIAFTWEHDVHLLQRRVLAANQRYGDSGHHQERLRGTLVPSGTEVRR